MTDTESTALMDRVQAIVAEHCTSFVFIMEVEDENGKNATIRRRVGSDSAVIGMMELLKHDLLVARTGDT
jgi:hypothetical protein